MPERMFPQPGQPKRKNDISKGENGESLDLDFQFDVESHHDQNLRRHAKVIRDFVKNPENYMDKGGAGWVYALGEDASLCVKIIRNRHDQPNAKQYDLGNNLNDEARFLRKLSDFSVEGVRSPAYVRILTGRQYGALVMEKLDAVNLQHIIDAPEKLPEKFDVEAFFNAVDAYVTALHEDKAVCHMDLDPRNLMVDRATGKPYIIDFGRAVSLEGLTPQERLKREEDDLNKIAMGEKALIEAIKTKAVKDY